MEFSISRKFYLAFLYNTVHGLKPVIFALITLTDIALSVTHLLRLNSNFNMRCGALCGEFWRHGIAHQPKGRSLHARRALLYRPVFFNRDSAEPKGFASGIQGFRGTAGAQ